MTPHSIVFLHTSPAAIAPVARFYAEHVPHLRITNMLDDAVLRFLRNGDEPGAERALLAMLNRAVTEYRAEAALVTCSSVSTQMAGRLAAAAGVPIIKIDGPMAQAAVRAGDKIGVLISFAPTLQPTSRLLEEAAGKAGKDIDLMTGIVEGAYDALLTGDTAKHDKLLREEARSLVNRGAEVVVLAQVSMAGLQPQLAKELPVPVLSSLETSLQSVNAVFPG